MEILFSGSESKIPTIKDLCIFYNLDEDYVNDFVAQCLRNEDKSYLEKVSIEYGYKETNRESYIRECITQLARNMFKHDSIESFKGEDWLKFVLKKKPEYKNIRLTKGHYKLVIKVFKLLAEQKSDVTVIDADGFVKTGTCFYSGENVYTRNCILLEALVKKGVFEVKYFAEYDSTYRNFKAKYQVKITELAKKIFDSEMIFELARTSQLGMEYYFQVMDMIKLYLSFFKVNSKHQPTYKG